MRQAGVIAAAGLYALDHNVERLAEDHAKASHLAEGLGEFSGITVVRKPETNIVVFQADNVAELYSEAREQGVLLSLMDAHTLRAVTHMNVSDEEIDSALGILRTVLARLSA
jgi:threonine aldolase